MQKRLAAAVTATAVVLAGGLSACASYVPYGPATGRAGVGYFEQAIEADRYRVGYHGPSGMSRNEVEDLAMLRAAELTLERGYDWFRVVGRYGDLAPPTTPRFSFGVGGASFGRRSAVDVSTASGFGGEPTFVANLEVLTGKGAKPPSPDVYDARSVAEAIRPRAPR
jgi:hypothetical protein